MSKHTNGPWTHEGQGDITGIENDPANGCVGKVDVACVYLRTVPGRHEANARLIAAAPDLLEALKSLERVLREAGEEDGGNFDWEAINSSEGKKARDAIRQATGETP